MASFGIERGLRLCAAAWMSISLVTIGWACSGNVEHDGGQIGSGVPGGASGTAGGPGGSTGGSGGAQADASVDSSAGSGGLAGSSGSAGSGGLAGSSGSAGSAGSAGTGGTEPGCVHSGPPVINPALFPECTTCDNAHCVPAVMVPTGQADLLSDCDATNKCVPDLLIETGGKFLLPSCRSVFDAEGRCLSLCLPLVAAQASLLPQDTCAVDERCVPCYEPMTGVETGACSLACDPGPQEPPVTASKCCSGIGSCVPSAMVPPDQQPLLGQDTCADADSLCAPNELLEQSAVPSACRSVADAEGRCLPACLPLVGAMGDLLPQGTCADTHLCAPCFNPLSGESTGACEINGDTPAEPPSSLPTCCTTNGVDRGTCVPSSLIPPGQAGSLEKQSCSDNWLCAPKEKVLDPTYSFPSCDAPLLGPGACLPSCFVDGNIAWMLRKGSCGTGEKCVPCKTAITGSTGACD